MLTTMKYAVCCLAILLAIESDGKAQDRPADPQLTTKYHSYSNAHAFEKAWNDAKEAEKGSRLRKWVSPDLSVKLVQSRGKLYFSDLYSPTSDMDGMLCKYILYDINDRPIGDPVYLKVSGFTGAKPPLRTVGFTIILAPGSITSSAEIWLVAGKQRATTGMFKL